MGRAKTQRRYSDKFKASALLLYQASTRPNSYQKIMEVCRHLDMPKTTFMHWLDTDVRQHIEGEVIEEARQEITELVEKAIFAVLEALPDAIAKTRNARDLAVAYGILQDKLQLLNGSPTSNPGTQRIEFITGGASSIPAHLTSGPTPNYPRLQEVQRN